MKMQIEKRLSVHIDRLLSRYSKLDCIRTAILDAYCVLEECFVRDKKLLIAGNGGSAADSEHIAGELMKQFLISRPVPAEYEERLIAADPVIGIELD